MDTQPDALSHEALLAELGWIRRLAQTLVRDATSADDLAQETYLAALERPPHFARSGPGLRAWLAQVTRSLAHTRARSDSRRRQREARAARVERDDTDLVEAVALRSEVASAVLALDEPYRSTLLRFHFEERTTAEIARSSGVSDATVRQRLVRARAQLRERLAATYGNGERGWVRSLLPLMLEDPLAPRGFPWRRLGWWTVGTAAGVGALAAVWNWAPAEPLSRPGTQYAYRDAGPEPDLVPDVRAAWERGGLARWLVRRPPQSQGVGNGSDNSQMNRSAAESRAALVSLPGVAARQVSEPSGEIRNEAAALSADVSVAVADVRPLELPRDLGLRVAAHTGHPEALMLTAELFEATMERPGQDGRVACRVLRLPLDLEIDEMRLVVVYYDGGALTAGVWGTEEFDDDPDMRWSAFLHQLLAVDKASRPHSLDSASRESLERLLADLDARDDEDSRFIRAVYEQRVAMAGNGMARRARKLAEARGAPPSPEWYTELAARMDVLANRSDALSLALGEDGAKLHRDLALSARGKFTELASALAAKDSDRTTRASEELSAACSACHKTQVPGGTLSFFDAFDPHVRELGIPTGQFLIDLGIAPAPGKGTAGMSRRIAAAFRAALILGSEI